MSSQAHKEKIIRWSNDDQNNTFILYNNLLEYLGENLFYDYEPMTGAHPDFFTRLEIWLNNIGDENKQKTLFELATKIFYVGREEFIALNRTAYNSIFKRWLFDKQQLFFNDPDFNNQLLIATKETWFCPITDSFRINQFYHVNQIESKHSFRPDWRSLKKFGSEDKIKKYLEDNNVKNLVLLEDFVGSGRQALKPIEFALNLDENLQILFLPLILCENGYSNITNQLGKYKNFTLSPCILLDQKELINENSPQDDANVQSIINLIGLLDPIVRSELDPVNFDKIRKFGYQDTGGLTVMFTNTPNNSLPLIHLESSNWKALFKRHSRD